MESTIDPKKNDLQETNTVSREEGSSAIVEPVVGNHGLKKNLSMFALIGFGLEVSNGWSGISGTLLVGLQQGGAVTIIYGLIFTGLMNVCIAASLAELSSAMPSAGGQYVWASVLAPARFRKQISFATGFLSIFSWVVINGSVFSIIGQYIMGLVQLFNPDFTIEKWHVFIVYEAALAFSVVWNIFMAVRTPWINTAFIYTSTVIFVAIIVACVARAPSFQDNVFVWGSYTNAIGWDSAFVVVSTGLINPAYCYLGLDSTVHLAEDSIRPARDIPIALFSTVCTAFFTGFTMAIALLYTIQDLDEATGAFVPFLTIMVQATRSYAGATVLLILVILVFIVTGNACLYACSRLVWSFASDGALPFKNQLQRIDSKLHVPILSILVSAVPIAVVGILYLASTTAYNSIVGSAIILSYMSFTVPIICLVIRGRKFDQPKLFSLGRFGWFLNVVVIIWCFFSCIMWLFPLTSEPAADTMNYAIAVLGIMGVLSLADWFLYARKHFSGPTSDEWFTSAMNMEGAGRLEENFH